MQIIIALVAGTLFGAGLTISDMVNPERVRNFLDLAGSWDPTLAFVMAGGLAVTAVGYRLIRRRQSPVCGTGFHLPTSTTIDGALVAGAGLFGIGWGIAGMCPGPAIADLVMLDRHVVLFIAAMIAGALGARVIRPLFAETQPVAAKS